MNDTDQIKERINNTEEVIDQLVKKNTELEIQVAKISETVIQDYPAALDTLMTEIRKINKNDKEEQLLNMVTSINEKLGEAPKPSVRQLRVLLFPETNQGQYYKIVFGRLIPWGLCFLVVTYIFITGYKAIGLYSYNQDVRELTHYKRAWTYLRRVAKKRTLLLMDTAYLKTADK